MAFDPLGTLTKARFASPNIISSHTAKICWGGPPNPIPAAWVPISPFEISALLALQDIMPANKYDYYSNVPLADIFTIDARTFLRAYNTAPHWNNGSKTIRKSAFFSLQKQIGIKMVDILVCEKNGKIVGGIEIDGSHHSKQPQQTWDFSKSMLFASKNIPLLRISTKSMQSVGGAAGCSNLAPLLTKSKADWKKFRKNPSIANMQLHNP